MVDFSQFNIDKDALLNTIAYNYAESPSTQAYLSTAAANNPDYAQMIGNIARFGDIDRANFNLGLQALTANNAAKAAREKEDRTFARQKELINLKRKQAIADRDRAERLQLLMMPEEELLTGATDWQNNVNPEQQNTINEYNSLATAKNNAQNLEDYLINSKKLNNFKKAHLYNSSIEAPTINTNNNEYIHGNVSPLKVRGLETAGQFSNKSNEAQNKIKILEDLANRSKNVFNREDRATNKGLRGVFNRLFGDSSLYNLENFMRTEQVGQTPWNANSKTIAIAQKLMNSPEFLELFGSNDLNDFQLLTDPTTFGIDKTYIVDKNTNKPYQIMIDDTGILRVYDPYEE